MQFFGSYLSNCLRSEAFYWLISPQLVSYLTEKEVTLEEINSPNLTKEHIVNIYIYLSIYIYIRNKLVK